MRHPETALQQACAQLLQVYETQGRLVWWPVPNSAFVQGRTAEERAIRTKKMIRAGLMRAGVWDIGLCFPGGRLALLELKTGDNGLSRTQRDFGAAAERMGALKGVARSVEDLQAFVSRCEMELGVRR